VLDAVADELDGVVKHLVAVEGAAEGDDDVLADDAVAEAAREDAPGDGRDLPPGGAGGPETGGVRAHDRRAQRPDPAVEVGVGVGADHHGTGDGVALFHHDLVADAGAGGVVVDAVVVGELFDFGVLAEVLGGVVLDVVVDGEDGLGGVGDAGRPARGLEDRVELWDDRPRVVVGHDVLGPDADDLALAGVLARVEADAVARGDLLDQCQTHGPPLLRSWEFTPGFGLPVRVDRCPGRGRATKVPSFGCDGVRATGPSAAPTPASEGSSRKADGHG
jgi:hypothetical protein